MKFEHYISTIFDWNTFLCVKFHYNSVQ